MQADAASNCSSSGNWVGSGTSVTGGGTCQLNDGNGLNAVDNDGNSGNAGAAIVSGDKVRLEGNFSQVDSGAKVEENDPLLWNDLTPADFIVATDPTDPNYGKTQQQLYDAFNAYRESIKGNTVEGVYRGSMETIVAKDQITGSDVNVNVYKNFNVYTSGQASANGSISPSGWKISAGNNYYAPDYHMVPDGQGGQKLEVIGNNPGLNLAKVEGGGELDIDIDGNLDARVKYGKIFMAEDNSTLNWVHEGVTNIDLSAEEYTNPQDKYVNINVINPTSDPKNFPATVSTSDGRVFTIRATKPDPEDSTKQILDAEKTAANIAAYNDYLVSVLKSGDQTWMLNQNQYNTAINQAFRYDPSDPPEAANESKQWKVNNPGFLDPSDELLIQNGYTWYDPATNILFDVNQSVFQMKADNSTINLTGGLGIKAYGDKSGYIIAENNTLNVTGQDATVLLDGATGRNEGKIIANSNTAVNIINGGGLNGVNADKNNETFINAETGTLQGSVGIYVENGRSDGEVSQIVNKGTVNGTYQGINVVGSGKIALTNSGTVNGQYDGVVLAGTGEKTLVNTGEINSAYGNGVRMNNKDAKFTNESGSSINIGKTQTGGQGTAANSYGIILTEGNAENAAGATINIGAQTQGVVGMQMVQGTNAASITNNGVINIESGWNVSNGFRQYMSYGIRAVGNGAKGGNRTVTNNGTINVDGMNSTGIGAIDYTIDSSGNYVGLGGTYVKLDSSSVINIGESFEGKINGQDVFYRNYGVYADGDDALIDLDGKVNMTGYGVIGVHARMGATVSIASTAEINTANPTGTLYEIASYDVYGRPVYKLDSSGNKIALRDADGNIMTGNVDANQIGYFIYGRSTDGSTSSSITNLADSLTLSTQASTLFRIEAGAEFIGRGQTLQASSDAAYSTLIVGVGPNRNRAGNLIAGDPTKVVTNDARLILDGRGSIGVFIGGGANGTISDAENSANGTATEILLNGRNSIGGVVDGRYQLIDESYVKTSSGKVVEWNGENGLSQTTLTNYADVRTGDGSNGTGIGEDVTGFITRNGGLLANYGNIELMNGENNTGIHILEHGRLQNHEDIHVGSGVGIHVEGEAGAVVAAQVENKGNIVVDDGRAGLLLDNGAYVLWQSGGGIDDAIVAKGTANGIELAAAYTDSLGRQHGKAAGVSIGVNRIDVQGTGNGVENGSETNYISFDETEINVGGNSAGIRTAVALVDKVLDKNMALTDNNSIVTINVSGNAVGYDFRASDANGGLANLLTNDTAVSTGYTVNVSDNGIGLRTNTSGFVYNEATVSMDASAHNVGWLAGTAYKAVNAGTIRSDSTNALLVDLANRTSTAGEGISGVKFYNIGTLQAANRDTLAVRGSNYDDLLMFTGNVAAAGSVRGVVNAGEGSDTLIWDAGAWDGSFTMGGGENNKARIDGGFGIDTSRFSRAEGSSGDGDILVLANLGVLPDSATFSGGSFDQDDLSRGVNFGNQWENIALQNTQLHLTGNIALDRNGTLTIDKTSRIYAGNLSNLGVSAVGNLVVTNAGAIDLTPTPDGLYDRGAAAYRDRFTIKGDYVGAGGEIWLDSYLETDRNWWNIAPSDQIILDGGHASGTTALVINGHGERGPGAYTYYDGIKVIDSKNGATTTDDAFIISSKSQTYQATPDGRGAVMIYGSAYVYRLEKGSPGTTNPAVMTDVYLDQDWANDWYLRSGPYHPFYKSTIPVYEAYPVIMTELAKLPTLQQRVGNRQWITPGENAGGYRNNFGETSSDLSVSAPTALNAQGRGLWVRWEGASSRADPRRSFAGAHSTSQYMNFQAGVDFQINDENATDSWIGGLEVHYRTGESKVRGSIYGSGRLKPDGIGFGGTLTWYSANKTYVDLQSAVTFYKTDIESDWTDLDGKDNARGVSYALSAEVGHAFQLNQLWSLTPQAQIQWSKFDMSSFQDKMEAEISQLSGGDSLVTRAGLALAKENAWTSVKGDMRRYYGYGIANLYYESLGNSRVEVAELQVFNSPDRWSGGLGFGGSYNWGNDKYALYGEVEARSSLENFGDSYSYGGTFGFRRSF